MLTKLEAYQRKPGRMSALLASLTRALGLHNLDADEIFSYQTTKVVSMLDHATAQRASTTSRPSSCSVSITCKYVSKYVST